MVSKTEAFRSIVVLGGDGSIGRTSALGGYLFRAPLAGRPILPGTNRKPGPHPAKSLLALFLFFEPAEKFITIFRNRSLLHGHCLSLEPSQLLCSVITGEKQEGRPKQDTNAHGHGIISACTENHNTLYMQPYFELGEPKIPSLRAYDDIFR